MLLLPGVLLGMLLGGGCINLDPVPDPTRSFVFEVLGEDETRQVAPDAEGVAIVVERVELPPYLEERRLVQRRGEFELEYSSINRWGEPMGEGIARTVAQYMGRNPGVAEIAYYPWKSTFPNATRIQLNVHRFEVWEDGRAELRISTTLRHPGAAGAVYRQTMERSYEGRVRDQSVEGRIHVQSLLLGRLADDLLEAIADFQAED